MPASCRRDPKMPDYSHINQRRVEKKKAGQRRLSSFASSREDSGRGGLRHARAFQQRALDHADQQIEFVRLDVEARREAQRIVVERLPLLFQRADQVGGNARGKRRGVADATELWQWHQDVVNGKIARRQINVVLMDEAGADTWRWVFEKAYPVKWSGGQFNAATNAVLVESVEFAHIGMKKG